jgi:hypothetical protein
VIWKSRAVARRLGRVNAALTLLLFIVLLALVDEGFATREHEVHHACELMGDGGIRRRLVHA